MSEQSRPVFQSVEAVQAQFAQWNYIADRTLALTVKLADGVEFASVTVIVTTLGSEFLRGVAGAVPVPDFPTPGQTRTLRWQQGQQNFILTAGTPSGGGTSGAPPHVLENPAPGSFQSGIGLISGWACAAQTITLRFDGGPPQEAAYGTPRGDTRRTCGDTDNGFGLLYNWNLLGDGSHHVVAYADGVEFARVDVTVTTLGAEFRRGLSGREIVTDFPEVGTDIRIHWQEAQQNFVISAAFPTLRLMAVDPYITLPNDIRIPNIKVSSFLSETAEVRTSPEPSLLLAEDAAGTVLLALANMDGGVLGEAQGVVEVSVDSTAVTLVGLTAGISVSDMTQSIVDVIVTHQQYPTLVAALTRRLRADTNFLDRLYDSPETERLLQEVAEPLAIAAIPQAVGASSSSQGSRSYATDIDAGRSTVPPAALTQTAGVGAECGQTPGDSVWNDPGLRERIQKIGLGVADMVINLSNNTKLGEDIADLATRKDVIDACERSQQRQWLRNNPDRIDIFDGVAGLQLKLPDLLRETLIYRQAVPTFKQACRDIHQDPEPRLSPLEKAFTLAAIIPTNKLLRAIPRIGPILGAAWEANQRRQTDDARQKLIDDIIQTIEECGGDEEEEPKDEDDITGEEENKPPEFEEASYTFTLSENRDGTRGGVSVGTVRAHDPEGQYAITYSVESGGYGEMRVDPQTGVVRYIGDGANYETSDIRPYHITVRATESGGAGLGTDVRVTVEIEDEDEPPYFREETYEFTSKVTHPRLVGRVSIGTVQAQDPEKTEIHHRLVSGDAARFSVSSDGRVTYCCYNDPLPGGEATHSLIVRATDSGGAGLSTDVPVNVRLVGDGRDHPYQLIYCRRDRDVEIEGSGFGWAGRSSWHCIDTELKHERPELFTPYRVCNEYNRTHAWLRGPDAMLMEVIGEYRYLAQCVEDIPVEVSCIGSHQGFCGYWGKWD